MKLKFVKKEHEIENVQSFYFEPPAGTSWIAGQFLEYTLPHPNEDDRGVKRWFTISTAPYEKLVRITTRINSEKSSSFKTALQQLSEGDEVEAGRTRRRFCIWRSSQKIRVFCRRYWHYAV
jgi:ferredoxin-NADP reductase